MTTTNQGEGALSPEPSKQTSDVEASDRSTVPAGSKKPERLACLSMIPPRWRIPAVIGLTMLVILCIVLSTVLSVVLSREHRPSRHQDPEAFKPIIPPSYPLAVKNPYLSAWIPGEKARSLPSTRAEFWTGTKLGWSVMASVDGDVYRLFGVENALDSVKTATVVGAQYTSTRSTFNLTVGGDIGFSLEFLSPIFPGADDESLRKQSLPLSFLTVTASSRSKKTIRIYSDVDHTWLGNNSVPKFNLSKDVSHSTHAWSWEREDPRVWEEHENMALWGQFIYSSIAEDGTSMTSSFGKRDNIRMAFIQDKKLENLDAAVPSWNDSGVPVTGYAHDLGKVSGSKSVSFGIGMTRDAGILFYGEEQTYYYRHAYPESSPIRAIEDAFVSLTSTRTLCDSLDQKVRSESLAVGGPKYADITTLSLRQVYGALDLTIPRASKDTSQASVYIKEISSNGDIQTLDIIYPAAPLFHWLSPEYIRLMLRPLAIYLEIGQWPHDWAVHDLGDHKYKGGYPKAVGHDNGQSEEMPLESTGNLLILAYMYYNSTQDRSTAQQFASDYKPLFTKYATFLQHNGSIPSDQLSTNDGAGKLANQTNLAIKAAVGLNAFGHMYENTTMQDEARNMAEKITSPEYGLSSDGSHLTLRYGHDNSWSVMFNLYPDVLLKMNTFNQTTYQMQSKWYQHLQANRSGLGVSIDSRGDYGSTNWMSFAGATDPENAAGQTGKLFISKIYEYLQNERNNVPFCDRYFVEGKFEGLASPKFPRAFRARPVIGGHFAFLARRP
ncbi:hypothetical protein IWX90DRAFT_243487 [Phyllosticta citrichinensis]|uniref:Glutaminase n=1 Tax=Phyllosticta citrichinensis TaxID=1130410 RepID=A0ABR1XQE8_9PEZI